MVDKKSTILPTVRAIRIPPPIVILDQNPITLCSIGRGQAVPDKRWGGQPILADHQGTVLRPITAKMCQTSAQSDKGTLGGGPGGTLHGKALNFRHDCATARTKMPSNHQITAVFPNRQRLRRWLSARKATLTGGCPDLGDTIATLQDETGCPQFLSRLCLGEQTMRNQTISPPLWPFEEMYLPATHLGRRNILR